MQAILLWQYKTEIFINTRGNGFGVIASWFVATHPSEPWSHASIFLNGHQVGSWVMDCWIHKQHYWCCSKHHLNFVFFACAVWIHFRTLELPLHVNLCTWGFHVLQWLVQFMLIMLVLAYLAKLVSNCTLLFHQLCSSFYCMVLYELLQRFTFPQRPFHFNYIWHVLSEHRQS